MNFDLVNIAVRIAIVIAVVNYIKTASGGKLGYYSVLVAIAVAFGISVLAVLPGVIDWIQTVKDTFIIALSSAGIYDIYTKKTASVI